MKYDYAVPRAYCAKHGLRFSEEMAAQSDPLFVELGLSQPQVDHLVCRHAWVVNHLFDPKNYSWRGRIMLAARFLFGIGGR